MSASILVTYATRYGSTQQVAEAIAAALQENGLEIELEPMRQVQTLKGYRAVVLGAPLYLGSLHKDAQRFLARYRESLTKRPPEGLRPEGIRVAMFALGPTRADDEWQGARTQLDQEMAKFPWLAPVALELFGGKYDPTKLRFPDSFLARLPASPLYQAPASDVRDWTAIRAWASNLAAKLQLKIS